MYLYKLYIKNTITIIPTSPGIFSLFFPPYYPNNDALIPFDILLNISLTPIAPSTQAAGAIINISRTITQAKYEASIPYRATNSFPYVTLWLRQK
jgi:hypothetical protein